MKIITRQRMLTREEAQKYDMIRAQIMQEFIERQNQPIELSEIREAALRQIALQNAATGPEWCVRITDDWPPGWIGVYDADDEGPIPHSKVFVCGRYDDEQSCHNAALAAASRTDPCPTNILKLLSEIEKLKQQLQQQETRKAEDDPTHY